MKTLRLRSCAILCFFCLSFSAYSQTWPSFWVIPLGVRGGSDESNLSAYMVAPAGSKQYVCLDAGTLHAGIQKAIDAGVFGQDMDPSQVQRQYIKAYLISHPHLDHVAGLVLDAPDDSSKSIYALPFCLDVLRTHYFTWRNWANFADQGEEPRLNKYHYVTLEPGKEMVIDQTELSVTAFPLSHAAPNQSTAFLIRSGDVYLLYLGDTGADSIEKSDDLHRLWEAVGPFIREGKLKALFIEVSFTDEQPVKQLFGHLTPRLLMHELEVLAQYAGEDALRQLPVVVTHRKPAGDRETVIRDELFGRNIHHWRLRFPIQGQPMIF